MTKTYIIDTNVILEDPYIVKKLQGEILVPTTVLQELDTKKHGNTEKNKNAREFARIVNREEVVMKFPISHTLDENTNDEKIIASARQARKDGKDVVIVTNDIYMSILAKSHGINHERGENRQNLSEEAYEGTCESGLQWPNEYMINKSGIFKNTNNGPKRLGKDKGVWNIKHKNAEQRCAIDALLDDNIKLVTISGRAGTGKTLLAIAAGLEKSITENVYQKLLVSRPVIPMGNEIGFLPGDINEKLGPWMQPIFDNIDFLFNTKDKNAVDKWEELEKEGLLKIEALTYIRGRSIPNQYIVIDEAQNLTKHEVKTIISRAGENTKIILTGDPDQIDNPKLDSVNNGLSYIIEKFKDQEIAAHVHLSKCERSELANIAAEIL